MLGDLKEILRRVDKLALREAKKYGSPLKIHYDIANGRGQQIAKKMKVDKDMVAIGTRLMDLKIGEAIKKDRLSDHIRMSFTASEKFLDEFDISSETRKKLLNCVDAHHGTIPYECKEAEVCANADCYRMLSIGGFLALFASLVERGVKLDEVIKYCEFKVDEKWKILSLDLCKKELGSNYKLLKQLFVRARK